METESHLLFDKIKEQIESHETFVREQETKMAMMSRGLNTMQDELKVYTYLKSMYKILEI